MQVTLSSKQGINLAKLLSLFNNKKRSEIMRVQATAATKYKLAQWDIIF
jgi:hypothetical protein